MEQRERGGAVRADSLQNRPPYPTFPASKFRKSDPFSFKIRLLKTELID